MDSFFGYRFNGGEFERPEVRFRDFVRADPAAEFPAERGRYHLYVSLACPWSHRAVLVRALRGLESVISLSVTNPIWGEKGWTFGNAHGAIHDTVNGADDVIDLYRKIDPNFAEPETVPILWDKRTGRIVNNESRDLMQMFDEEFTAIADAPKFPTLAPKNLRSEIDTAIDAMYMRLNNGVYRAGFARSQRVYERAAKEVFAALDEFEVRLGSQTFVVGETLTLADLSLFVTVLRFDPVYYSHFKCNMRRIRDYPHLSRWMREVYVLPGVAETCNFEHIKNHYYGSHPEINPTGIIPIGPELDLPL